MINSHWLSQDTYVLQRLPSSRYVVVNFEYTALSVIEPRSGREIRRLDFFAGYSGVVDAWCLRADGGAALVLSDESKQACLLDFNARRSYPISHSPWDCTISMPYDWIGDTLWLKDPAAYRFAKLDLGHGVIEECDPVDVLAENRQWRRVIDRISAPGIYGMRVNPDRPDLVFIRSSSESTVSTGGVMGWRDQVRSEVTLPLPAAKIGRMASLRDRLVLLQEYEAVLLGADGSVARRFPVDEGFHYFDLDVVPADAENSDLIVLGAASLSGMGSKLVVHDVSDGSQQSYR